MINSKINFRKLKSKEQAIATLSAILLIPGTTLLDVQNFLCYQKLWFNGPIDKGSLYQNSTPCWVEKPFDNVIVSKAPGPIQREKWLLYSTFFEIKFHFESESLVQIRVELFDVDV